MIRAVLAVFAVFSLVIGGTWIWLRLDQPIRVVRVEGAASVAEQDAVQSVLDDALVNGVLSIDLEELTTRIFALSWPREVRVRRLWPNGLVVRVQREPFVAAWGDSGFLTSAGKVVLLPGHDDDSLPVLSAELSSPAQTMETFLLLQERLRGSELTISGLSENVIGEWALKLDNGIELMLGSSSLAERLARFVVLYHRVLEERMPAPVRVDARYQNALAVHLDAPEKPPENNLLALENTPAPRSQESDTRHGFRY
jgi:cell division protein FtsQ